MSFVYGFQCGDFIKIGRAADVGQRLRDLRLGNPLLIKIVLRRRHPRAALVEQLMHRVLREEALGREWFKITPADARLVADYAIGRINDRLERERDWAAARPVRKPKTLQPTRGGQVELLRTSAIGRQLFD